MEWPVTTEQGLALHWLTVIQVARSAACVLGMLPLTGIPCEGGREDDWLNRRQETVWLVHVGEGKATRISVTTDI